MGLMLPNFNAAAAAAALQSEDEKLVTNECDHSCWLVVSMLVLDG
jgi:hypothetical protein